MKIKYLLQFGLAATFLYAGIDALRFPFDWVGFVPQWVTVFHVTTDTFLRIHSVFEILAAVWLLTGIKVRWVGFLLAADLLVIVVANGFSRAVFTTTFRDIGLFFTALYLFLEKEQGFN